MFSRDGGTGLRVNLLDVRVRQEITESKQHKKSLRHHNLNSHDERHFSRIQRLVINHKTKNDNFFNILITPHRFESISDRRKSKCIVTTYATKNVVAWSTCLFNVRRRRSVWPPLIGRSTVTSLRWPYCNIDTSWIHQHAARRHCDASTNSHLLVNMDAQLSLP